MRPITSAIFQQSVAENRAKQCYSPIFTGYFARKTFACTKYSAKIFLPGGKIVENFLRGNFRPFAAYNVYGGA
jgi:hypothetical protein